MISRMNITWSADKYQKSPNAEHCHGAETTFLIGSQDFFSLFDSL